MQSQFVRRLVRPRKLNNGPKDQQPSHRAREGASKTIRQFRKDAAPHGWKGSDRHLMAGGVFHGSPPLIVNLSGGDVFVVEQILYRFDSAHRNPVAGLPTWPAGSAASRGTDAPSSRP